MTPPDLGRSLGHRLRNQAAAQGVDPQRLRRLLVFQRMLVRLVDDGGWVLKGGFCLELRLGLSARTTRDLDLALVGSVTSARDLQDRLVDALLRDPQADGFAFRVGRPVPISADELGNPGWRTTVQALVLGAQFETVKVDVVVRPAEIEGGTERLTVRSPLDSPQYAAVDVPAVDVAQHAAEKLHAYCRVYARDRPSSRVKDLVDLVLLIEAGLLDPRALASRLTHVFHLRNAGAPPGSLPTPPASWTRPYAATAAELRLAAADVDAAYHLVAAVYERTINGHRTDERNS